MNRIIFTNTDGSIGIISPAKGISLDRLVRDVPTGLDYEIVDETDIPSDRTFRNAWMHDRTSNPQKVSVRSAKARDMSLDRVRTKRNKLFEVEVDKPRQDALNDGSTNAKANAGVETRREELKTSTDGLKALVIADDEIMSTEEAASLLLPLEEVA